MSLPRGWFCIDWSDGVPVGTAKSVTAFDRQLLVYRGESGAVQVFDAYCPHQGANLGVGGRVVGDDIVCPFHGWRYCQGKNVEIPYSVRPNPSKQLTAWPVRESGGAIHVWFDADRGEPLWEPPVLTTDTPAVRRVDRVEMMPRMALETMMDVGRWAFAHGARLQARRHAADGPVYRAVFDAKPLDDGECLMDRAEVEIWGVGIIVLRVDGPHPGSVVTFATPVDRRTTELRSVVTSVSGGAPPPGLVTRRWEQLERDITVWQHQTYLTDPPSGDDDDLEFEVRRWADGFSAVTP